MRPPLASLLLLAGCTTTGAAVPARDATQVPLEQLVAAPAPAAPIAYRPLPATAPMQVVLVPVPGRQLVSLRLVFRTGSVDDPPGKEGLTALTTRLLLEGGTATLTSAQLLEALYPLAGELGGDTDKEFTTITGRVHVDRLDRFLAILAEVLTAPRFDPKEFARLKDDQLTAIRTRLRQENDEELSKVALDALLFDGHPYRHHTGGTVAGLEAITLEDVIAHAKGVFTQDRLLLGLAGAVDESLAGRVKASLGALPARGVTRPPLPPTPSRQGETLLVQRETRSTAGAFGFASPLRRGDPDFIPLFVALSYFGEHRQEHGVLFRELRDKRGLNYGTYAYAQHYRQEGWAATPKPNVLRSQQDVMVWLRPVSPEHAVFATRGVMYFLEQLRDMPPPAARFETARGFLAGTTRIWTMTDQHRLGWAMDDVLSGTGDFLAEVRQALETLTPEQVQDAARKYVRPEAFNFVYVTKDAAGLAAALTKKAQSPISYPTPKPPEVLRDDEAISRALLSMDPARVRVVPADDVMAR
jgi:zinc protease